MYWWTQPMTATASRAGATAALAVAYRITSAADSLRACGAEPQRALRTALSMGDIPPEIEAIARAIWAIVIDRVGDSLATLPGILACADTLCSLDVAPCDAIGVLRWIDAPDDVKALARDTWALAVGSGAVVRVAWSFALPPEGSGGHGAAVADGLSRILVLADSLRSIGVPPCNVLDVLRLVALPPGLAAVVRAAWAFAAGFDDDLGRRGIAAGE